MKCGTCHHEIVLPSSGRLRIGQKKVCCDNCDEWTNIGADFVIAYGPNTYDYPLKRRESIHREEDLKSIMKEQQELQKRMVVIADKILKLTKGIE